MPRDQQLQLESLLGTTGAKPGSGPATALAEDLKGVELEVRVEAEEVYVELLL